MPKVNETVVSNEVAHFWVWLKKELTRPLLSADIDHNHLTKDEALKLLKKIKRELEQCL